MGPLCSQNPVKTELSAITQTYSFHISKMSRSSSRKLGSKLEGSWDTECDWDTLCAQDKAPTKPPWESVLCLETIGLSESQAV